MQSINFGDKLQILRREKGFSQKEFAEYLNIPQPSMSAYENGRNSPTMEVLIGIAQKCNASLDWLCGLSSSPCSISTPGDITAFIYKLMEIEEIRGVLEVDTDYARITFYRNDHRYKHNADICDIIRIIKDNFADLETYAVSKSMYDMVKEKTINDYTSLPLTKRLFPELNREDRLKKHMKYLKSYDNN